MKARFGFIDPGAIMSVVVSLIILVVGVYAFFVVSSQTLDTTNTGFSEWNRSNWTSAEFQQQVAMNAVNNSSATGDSVFNIVGVVMIIGAIMAIVGLVYNYVR